MPVIVREMTDDEATLAMVNSNRQREQLLPSERAFAYKMMMDAMRHQGSFDTSSQLGTKSRSDEFLAAKTGVSRNQVQRFIRLTELIPELMTMVDKNSLAINTAVELSYLTPADQQVLLDVMHAYAARPSMVQAKQLRLLPQKARQPDKGNRQKDPHSLKASAC